ncbi:MAG: hypothetical protein H6649_06735 [Caldilineae bacterium]|nr:hypothetical protein [Anaerolineae bacterium]MCB0205216.1 hypothetical protein [Anaerolineae bacterium]MCB9153734.1 hypothetical protein [Caldilineae bacterium]
MIRTVPETINEDIDLYIRTYYSLLRSSQPIRVRSLEDTHAGMHASLHPHANDDEPDMSAFAYAVARLPECMHRVKLVLLGQSDEVFFNRAGVDITDWRRVYAIARRRKMFFDGQGTLACYISSVSDIDDLIPILTAYQIEWNKLHRRFHKTDTARAIFGRPKGTHLTEADLAAVQSELGLDSDSFQMLQRAWHENLDETLRYLANEPLDLRLNLLAGSAADYRQAVQAWWFSVQENTGLGLLVDRSIYFVSSNPHSLPNLLCGHIKVHREAVIDYLRRENPEDLWPEWERLVAEGNHEASANLLYYVDRSHRRANPEHARNIQEQESRLGIHRIDNPNYLDVGVQVIELGKLDPNLFDPRICVPGLERLAESDALLFNIDYPLGMAAYTLFSQVSSSIPDILGVYIMGKAATLNCRVGDIMLPNVVYDEHSKNTFLFKNSIEAADVAPYLLYGTVFDNQKSVTVRGTFLQNQRFMDVFYKEGYTDIEMEAGPYLSGVYEDIYPQRYPINEIVNLFINAPYDIGILHYASDRPYGRGQSLLSKNLSYFGVDATYAASTAILRRIFQVELKRLAS